MYLQQLVLHLPLVSIPSGPHCVPFMTLFVMRSEDYKVTEISWFYWTISHPSNGSASPWSISSASLERSDHFVSRCYISLTVWAVLLTRISYQSNAPLIIRHHVVTPDEPDDLLRHLLQICTYHMDVRPLSSGRSGAVSGEVSIIVFFQRSHSFTLVEMRRSLCMPDPVSITPNFD
jgi:hypothetical protein